MAGGSGGTNFCRDYFPIAFCVALILNCYFTFMWSFLPGLVKVRGGFVPVIGNPKVHVPYMSAMFGMIMINWLLAHFSSPGRVPSKWPWDPSSERYESSGTPTLIGMQIERKMDGKPRFCRICGKFKPDRTHHCRQCGKCTLQMDHHCPYIRNCVGFLNYKYFVLLLVYGVAGIISYVILMRFKFFQVIKGPIVVMDIIIIFSWFLAIAMSGVLTMFLGMHCWLIYNAYTTIEFCEKYRAKDAKQFSTGQKVKDVYKTSLFQKGLYQNFVCVFGPNPLFWLLPVRWGMSNDGTSIKPGRKPLKIYYNRLGLPDESTKIFTNIASK